MIPGLLVLLLGIGQDTLRQTLAGGGQLEGTRATVSFMAPDSGKAVRVLTALEVAPPLPGLPPDVPTGVLVLLAPDESVFERLTSGQVPDWGAGVALPAQATIVMPAYVSARGRGWSDTQVLRHEWAHIGLHQYLQGLRVPRWFSEGYAQWASGGWDWSEGWKLRVALARDRNPLDSLDLSWPRDQGEGPDGLPPLRHDHRVPGRAEQPPCAGRSCSGGGRKSVISIGRFDPRMVSLRLNSRRTGGAMSRAGTAGCSSSPTRPCSGCS